MRVLNKHKARIAGVAPGASEEVDEKNPTVAAAIAEGLLVDAAKEVAAAIAAIGGDSAIIDENVALKAKIAEMEAALATAKAPAKPVKGGSKAEG